MEDTDRTEFQVLTLALPSPGGCKHLGNVPAHGKSLALCLSNEYKLNLCLTQSPCPSPPALVLEWSEGLGLFGSRGLCSFVYNGGLVFELGSELDSELDRLPLWRLNLLCIRTQNCLF